MTQNLTPVNVNSLSTYSSISASAQLLTLVDSGNNTVGLVNKTGLASYITDTTSGNLITSGANGLYASNYVGNLSNLTTTDKTSAVSAINELVSSISTVELPTVNTLSTSGTIALTDNSYNKITPTGNVTFSLPTSLDGSKFHQILVQANVTNVLYLSGDRLGTSYYFNQKKPTFNALGHYDIVFEYDNIDSNWYVGAFIKGTI